MAIPEAPLPAGLLLAAGGSQRLGQPKQLLRYHGQPLVWRAARLLLSLGLPCVSVVTGSSAGAVESALEELPVQRVRNEAWASGMGSSISSGVRSLGREPPGVLILLCDQWRLNADDLWRLLRGWKRDISHIVVSESGGNHGPPVIFPRSLFRELERLKPEDGAKQVIRRHGEMAHPIRVENAAFDLDTPADLEALRAREESN
ncbi:MAG: nucleotidyltransferase family protein [Xanthomonadales bacterium]|nr:nucleotidyltransferase family protein [Xanthomonadales bacterium]